MINLLLLILFEDLNTNGWHMKKNCKNNIWKIKLQTKIRLHKVSAVSLSVNKEIAES